jgi:hypothetical protein
MTNHALSLFFLVFSGVVWAILCVHMWMTRRAGARFRRPEEAVPAAAPPSTAPEAKGPPAPPASDPIHVSLQFNRETGLHDVHMMIFAGGRLAATCMFFQGSEALREVAAELVAAGRPGRCARRRPARRAAGETSGDGDPMKERPILFMAPMVRALLAGEKTETRRIVKPQPAPLPADVPRVRGDQGFWWSSHKTRSMVEPRDMGSLGPYGCKGDVLWVKETFASVHGNGVRWVYRADGEDPRGGPWTEAQRKASPMTWSPSIFMPKKLSRLLLTVTGVRVERLQEITEEGAKREGFPLPNPQPGKLTVTEMDGSVHTSKVQVYEFTARGGFAHLWSGMHGHESWTANPWVWVVSFARACMTCRGRGFTTPGAFEKDCGVCAGSGKYVDAAKGAAEGGRR